MVRENGTRITRRTVNALRVETGDAVFWGTCAGSACASMPADARPMWFRPAVRPVD